jgi:rhodanese-related sulfurtransferase
LAGPANRQGRIAAENALGGNHSYKGSIGTSVVRVFEAVAGITGFSLKQARAAGMDADAVVVHKEHHTSYYPGAETVTTMLIYDRNTGIILGGQAAGYKGADKRLDVIATATAAKLTISDIADIDFAYSPPIGTANDAINMAAYTAENRISGFSPSVTVAELDAFIEGQHPVFVDIRDVFAFEKSHVKGAIHLPLELLSQQMKSIPANRTIIIYCETGKKAHQALRTLLGAGFKDVTNISGGHTSLQRQARTTGFKFLKIDLLPVELKSVGEETAKAEEKIAAKARDTDSQIVVDVRTPEEFKSGAYPGAINIPLDELQTRINELGRKSREITLYCASGARSAYAQRVLMQIGYTNVKNGGGIAAMMASRNTKPAAANLSAEPIIVDVRTPQEFAGGAYKGAINIPLDDLQIRIKELGSKSREITLYCASGARSAYGQRVLQQLGFTNTKNGGGIMQMMSQR